MPWRGCMLLPRASRGCRTCATSPPSSSRRPPARADGRGSPVRKAGRHLDLSSKDRSMAESQTKARRMRELLRQGIVVSPGVYDGYSVRLAEQAGFKAASTTGAGLANSRLGQPDIGIMSLRDNVEACRHIARSVSIPVMSDADTGYGNAVTVYHTVQYFEEAGVVGINIEDQVNPKRCGHMRGKELIGAGEMARKIEAALK